MAFLGGVIGSKSAWIGQSAIVQFFPIVHDLSIAARISLFFIFDSALSESIINSDFFTTVLHLLEVHLTDPLTKGLSLTISV